MKPIIFSTPMVQEILAGHKTQTRRVIKPQPFTSDFLSYDVEIDGNTAYFHGKDTTRPIDSCVLKIATGDILWVRETWQYGCDGPNGECVDCGECDGTIEPFLYKAGYDSGHLSDEWERELKWARSTTMPRKAARIFLRVTGVRAERLQDISHLDCIAEGMRITSADVCASLRALDLAVRRGQVPAGTAANAGRCELLKLYHELWDTINANRSYGWDANPWVLVYTFKRCDGTEGTL